MDATTVGTAFPGVASVLDYGPLGVLTLFIVLLLRKHETERKEWREQAAGQQAALFSVLTDWSTAVTKLSSSADAQTAEMRALCKRMDDGFAGIIKSFAMEQRLDAIAVELGIKPKKKNTEESGDT